MDSPTHSLANWETASVSQLVLCKGARMLLVGYSAMARCVQRRTIAAVVELERELYYTAWFELYRRAPA